jgi:hypothetical protein
MLGLTILFGQIIMISLLSKGIPYTEKGSLVYYYEEGHKRYVLNCINKVQKNDESMYTAEEADHVSEVFGRFVKLLEYDFKSGLPKLMTNIIYLTIVLNFVGLITLLVCSNDFYNVIKSENLLLVLVASVVTLTSVIILIASYKYYSNTVSYLNQQRIKIQTIIDELNLNKAFGLVWTKGEFGLWIKIEREDLIFYNEYPDDLDEEFVDKQSDDNEADSEDYTDK